MDLDYYRCCSAEKLVDLGSDISNGGLTVALSERLDHKTRILDEHYAADKDRWDSRDELLECLQAVKDKVVSLEDMIENLQSRKD